MSHYDKLLASAPINKQAAIVTYYSGEEEDELKALIAQANYLGDAIKAAKEHRHMSLQDVQKLGRDKHKIQTRIAELKAVAKARHKSSIGFYFTEVCRRELPNHQFLRLMKLAMDERDRNTFQEQTNDR